MARASIKEDLIKDINEGYEILKQTLDQLDTQADFDFEDRDRNPRDIIAHLYEWQRMFMKWYSEGKDGGKPSVPKEGYTWSTIGPMNEEIRLSYQNKNYDVLIIKLDESHHEVLDLVNEHSNHDLYAREIFPWTNDTVLGSYISSATSSHYEWAVKKLKKQIRLNKKK